MHYICLYDMDVFVFSGLIFSLTQFKGLDFVA